MADALPMGIDPSQLQSLLAAFAPDKNAAMRQGLLTLGLGMLGMKKGAEAQGLGQAGLLGVDAYNQSLQRQMALRAQEMQSAGGMIGLMNNIRMTDAGLKLINGGDQSQPTPQSMPQSGAPQPFMQPGGATAAFNLATGGSAPPVQSLPTQAPPQPAAMPGAVPRWANPNTELGFALMGKNDVATAIHRNFQIAVSRNGIVTQGGQLVGQFLPDGQGYVSFPGGDTTRPQFQAPPKEALDAMAAQSGKVAGAQAGAKANYDLVEVPIGNGQTRQMTRADAIQFLSQGQSPAPPPAPSAPQGYSLRGNFTPQDLQRIQADANGTKPFIPAQQSPQAVPIPSQGTLGGPGLTPSPLAMAAGQAAIDTAAKENQGFNATNQATAQKQLESYQESRPVAYKVLAALDNLERTDAKGIYTGSPQNVYKDAAMWVNSLVSPFGIQIDTSKITNSDTYHSALQTLGRANLKQFPGGRIFQSEFSSVIGSLPSAATTPEGRAAIRAQMGADALNVINQGRSAEAYFNPRNGLTGWTPPAPITPDNYWSARPQIMGLQPRQGLTPQQMAAARHALQSGNPQVIRAAILAGVFQ
jgi:hypothetical protein